MKYKICKRCGHDKDAEQDFHHLFNTEICKECIAELLALKNKLKEDDPDKYKKLKRKSLKRWKANVKARKQLLLLTAQQEQD